ncbi:MAG: SUMF1/EgtB/PvdO family nonheme iron enzyme [Planctomycetia bacterium]|nr:SUMF1/EgtB/PvdO family nonheme iron enzyme [Planctomycetia bacterium]
MATRVTRAASTGACWTMIPDQPDRCRLISLDPRAMLSRMPPEQPASDSVEPTLTYQQRDVPSPKVVLRYFGDYELIQEIARGGMGVVFKARQVTLNRIVAVKMILGGQLAGPEDVQRFHTEAEAAAQLDHPGIVPVYEVGEQDGQHFFSMGFVEGQSLAKRVAEGPLEPRAAAEIVKTVSEAVQYAHDKGVIHRDLKPGNILLDKEGKPRVTDFGLAKLTESGSDLTGTGQILGTPSYMPPEQAAGEVSTVGRLSDVYSMGAILYCLLTGRPPFQAASPLETLLQVQKQEPVPPRHLNSGIPLDLNTISLKCLEKDPARRYQSAQDVAKELQRFLIGEPIVARPISMFDRSWRWCKRRPLIPSVVAAVLAVSIVGGLMYRHAAAIERQQSLQREVVTAVDAMQNATGPIVSYGVRDLHRLPRDLVLHELKSRYESTEVRRQLGLTRPTTGVRPASMTALAYALAEYGEPVAPFLCSQIARSAPAEVDNFVSAFRHARNVSRSAINSLANEIGSKQDWRLKARLAVVALHLGDGLLAADMCRIEERPDPAQRTIFIDELSAWHGDVAYLEVNCRMLSDPGLRSAICLAIGSLPPDRLTIAGKSAWERLFAEWFQFSHDNVTHSAAGWALRQWGTELPVASAPGQPSENCERFVNSLGMTMLKVQPGGFDRVNGSAKQTVKLTWPFFLGDLEVSVDQFQKFMDDPDCPKADKPVYWQQGNGGTSPKGDHPRDGVSWYDAVLFCNWLSRKEGFAPCYERTGKKVKGNFDDKQEFDEWQLSASGTGYRLPTEAEWEYACRAGTTTDFACGTDAELLRKYAFYATGTTWGAAACGSRLPNGWGLFDMHGNVWEWCHDRYGDYGDGNVSDPVGPSDASVRDLARVYRGGSWYDAAAICRSRDRNVNQPDSRSNFYGFRPALSAVRPVQ